MKTRDILESLTWDTFKGLVDAKALSVQWVDVNNVYWLLAVDGGFTFGCSIAKTDPAGTEQAEFEADYKTPGNKPTQARMIQVLGEDIFTMSPISLFFTATKNIVTTHDKLMDYAYAVRGGMMSVPNYKHGDWVKLTVIDKDDVLGYGGTPENPIQLADYVPEWGIMPGINELMDVSIGRLPVAGLYLRLEYSSCAAATEDAKGILNLVSYKVIE